MNLTLINWGITHRKQTEKETYPDQFAFIFANDPIAYPSWLGRTHLNRRFDPTGALMRGQITQFD